MIKIDKDKAGQENRVPFPLTLALSVPEGTEFEQGVNARDTITWGQIPPSDDD